MRLIDADKLIRTLKRLAANAALEDRFEDLSRVSDAIHEVGKQPTAYDLDGVLERLEEEKNPMYRGDSVLMRARIGMSINKAIEIVKGGVNNDK